jgi:hypothetical protein
MPAAHGPAPVTPQHRTARPTRQLPMAAVEDMQRANRMALVVNMPAAANTSNR